MASTRSSFNLLTSLRAKLIGAFSAVMIILAIIGLTSFFALKSASDGFKDYRELARDSNLAGILQSNMLMVRMNVKDFLLTGSNKDIEQYTQYFNDVDALLKKAKTEINNPQRAEMVSELSLEINTYNATFDVIKQYRVERNILVNEQLNTLGPQMEKDLTDLMLSASNSNNIQVAHLAGLAMRNLLLGRLYVIKFLESNEESAAQRVRQEFSAFDTQIAQLQTASAADNSQSLINKVNDNRNSYLDAFEQTVNIINDRNDKVTNTLDVIGPKFASLVDDLKLSVKRDQDQLGPQLKTKNENAINQIVIFFSAALALSAVIVFFLTKVVMKQLGKDPTELEHIALAIAKGDLDQEYDEHKPEGVFKSMLSMRDNLKIGRDKEMQERRIAQVNARIKNALDNASSSVMITDKDHNVIYMNDAINTMFSNIEKDIRTESPGFNAKQIINTPLATQFDYFKTIQNNINHLTNVFNGQFVIGGRTFILVASPVIVDNQRVGTVFEWEDKTDWLTQEQEKTRIASENARVKYALDGSSGRVMITDKSYNVIYLNDAIKTMFAEAENAIQSVVSDFTVQAVLGAKLDTHFSHFSDLLNQFDDQQSSIKTELIIAGHTFSIVASPVNVNDERVGTVIEWEDKTQWLAQEQEKTRIASENARVKYALDSVSGNVMIADPDLNIIYANNELKTMFNNVEADLKTHINNFDAQNLFTLSIEQFYLEPEQQKHTFEALTSTYRSTEHIGNSVFALTANPIFVDNHRIGTVLEWVDRTAEVNIEKEIDTIVHAASHGDLSKKIDIQGKSGFFEKLSTGLNLLVETVEVSVNDVTLMLGAMAQGDLSKRITNEYAGTFGQLKEDTNATADKLTEIIFGIRSAASSISQGANEIAQGNADLSQRTEEQASSLEQTSASMDEITEIVQQSAVRSEEANDLAQEAKERAESGGNIVSQAVSAMREINDSSKKIAEIISVIDEIAFQTNLLALNAAVEAARAGEQGRGFAVVAGEVRNLAQRSSSAAKGIKDLIRDSQVKVAEGTELVNRSGDTLREIVESNAKVRDMMQELAESARHQSDGIRQINSAVTQMDEMTQQNAALVEEAAAAGESMAEQARGMNETVDFFRT